MSSVETIYIQGIRSFGPEACHAQKLQFFSPLTLIVGPNGSGKTTIIECLKYATTGEMPPGTKQDAAFIYDPKLINQTTVKGQVKLRFTDVRGALFQVTRAVEVLQKKQTPSLRTLDATLHRYVDGKLESLPGKCADVHSEVISLFGVSRAILESVIFCHQEEQFWPLAEPKSVKETFDDIFASAEYVRAIEALKKLRLAQTNEAQTARSNIPYLRTLRDAVAEKRRARDDKLKKRDRLMASIDESRRQVEVLTEQLKPLQSRKSEHSALKERAAKLAGERNQLELALKQLQRSAQPDALERARKCTRTELDDALRRLATERARIAHEIGEAQFSVEECERSRQRIDTTVKPLAERETRLRIELEQYETARCALERAVHRFNDDFKLLPSGDSNASQPGRGAFVAALAQRIAQLEASISEAETRYSTDRRELEDRVQTTTAALTKRNEQTNMKADELTRLRSESARLRSELATIRAELTANEKEVERHGALNERLKSLDSRAEEIASARLRIEELRSKRSVDEAYVARVESRLAERQANSQRSAQIDILRKRAREAREEIRRVLDRHGDALLLLFANDAEVLNILRSGDFERSGFRFRKHQEALGRTLATDVRNRRTEQSRTTTQLAECNTQRAMLRDRLVQLESDVQSKRAALADIVASNAALASGSALENFDAVLDDAKAQKVRLSDRKGVLVGKQKLFEEYSKRIREQRERANQERARAANPAASGCCPLCRRSFERQTEASELVDELDTECSVNIPNELEQLEEELANAVKRYEDLLASRSAFVELARLENEVENLRSKRIDLVEKDALRLRGEADALEAALRDLERSEASLKQVANDLFSFDSRARELDDANEQLDKLAADESKKSETEPGDELDGLTLEELSRRVSEFRSLAQRSQAEIEEKQSAVMKHGEDRQKVLDELNKLGTLRTQIDAKKQRAVNLTEEVSRTDQDCSKIEGELEQLRNVELRELSVQVEEARAAYSQLENAQRERVIQIRDQLSQFVDARESLERDARRLESLRADEKREEKVALDRRIEGLRVELTAAEQRVSDARRLIEDLRKRENNHSALERDAQVAIDLKTKMTELEEATSRVRDIESSIAMLRVEDAERDMHELARRIEAQKGDACTKQGEQVQLESELREIEKQLSSKENREADQALLSKRIECVVRQQAASDLNTIMQCLEKAILTYHQHKMAEINKIMRNLWRSTYKGNDIDFIQILTDVDDDGLGQAGAADRSAPLQIGTSSRRRYRYRVVMSKGGQLLDLRGRCSAGQKVLASIVIRLALAEVFGGRCALLALDEPTTNLDQENVASLAEALIEIVNQRRAQKNFQLIIITHDEEFVKQLSRADFVSEFYRISRGADACSCIEKRLIHELHDD